jgi:long-chain fatty acid transport protein
MSARASASGYDTARFGAERGHAATFTPLATFYNPAALSFTRKVHLAIDATLALRSASFERAASDVPEPSDAQGANTGRAELRNVLAGPTLAASYRFGDLTLGAGFFAPYAPLARWDGNAKFKGNSTYPGAQDGVARFHLIEGDIILLYMSAGAAYRIEPLRLSFGASLHAVRASVRLTRALTASFDDNLRDEGRLNADVSGWVLSAGAGVMWEALPDELWLAASYTAPAGGYDGMVLSGSLRTAFEGQVSREAIDLHQTFPDVFRLAVRYRPSARYELRLFGDYTRWGLLENQCVSAKGEPCKVDATGAPVPGSPVISNAARNWNDAFGVRVSGSYFPSERWEVLGGLGYDSNAIPDRMLEPSTLEGDDLGASLGVGFELSERLALTVTYTHLWWLPRDTTGKSRLDEYAAPSRLPDAGGKYTQNTAILDALLEVRFD